jgi:diketogulonate reductase-like aldo/keto reductase
MSETPSTSTPSFLYGTAWKEDRTAALTELAIRSGFRGIDTANQRKHYFEAAVGEGLAAAYREGIVTRGDLFLQTKLPRSPDRTIGCRMIRRRV